MGTHCDRLVDSGRRKFLTGASVVAVSAAASTVVGPHANAEPAAARVTYPSNRLGNVRDLKINEPLTVAYPDADAPGVLIKLGTPRSIGRWLGRRYRWLLHRLPAQGIPARLQQERPHAELSRSLLAFRCRGWRSPNLGPCDSEPPTVCPAY